MIDASDQSEIFGIAQLSSKSPEITAQDTGSIFLVIFGLAIPILIFLFRHQFNREKKMPQTFGESVDQSNRSNFDLESSWGPNYNISRAINEPLLPHDLLEDDSAISKTDECKKQFSF